MSALLRRWFNNIQFLYQNPLERQRALAICLMSVVLAIFATAAIFVFILPIIDINPELGIPSLIITIAMVALSIFSFYAAQSSNLKTAAWTLVLIIVVDVVFLVVLQRLNQAAIVLLMPALVAAGLLLERRGIVIVTGLLLIASLLGAFSQSSDTEDMLALNMTPEAAGDFASVSFALVLTSAFFLIFSGGNTRIAREVEQNRRDLSRLDDFDRSLRAITDQHDILMQTAIYLTEQMYFSAVHTYLFDGDGQLNRYSRTGMGTRHAVNRIDWNMERGTALADAINVREMMIISPDDPEFRRRHMMPSSTFGVLLPLVDGRGEAIGALDIQSNRRYSPFSENVVRTLRLIANRMAFALETHRERDALHRILHEREDETLRLQALVAELRRLGAAGTGAAWGDYLQGRGDGFIGFDLNNENAALVPAGDLPAQVRAALEHGDAVTHEIAGELVLSVPIQLRDEMLGAMAFTMPPGQIVNERQVTIARIVAQRLALALENTRLVEQSQAQAARESKASEVASSLIGQQSVDAVLALAAANFQDALGAIYTQIYLEPDAFAVQATDGEEAV